MKQRIGMVWLACGLTAFAADWASFRGPNGSGVAETKLPSEIAPDKNVLWKIDFPPGHSSPSISGNRIFLTAYEGDKLLTIALDRTTGKEIWRVEAPRPRKEVYDKRNSPASPTPAADGKSVFVFFGDYGMLGYDHATGKEIWRTPLGPFNNVYGMGSSPVLVDDKVILVCDHSDGSFAIAFSKTTGKVIWKRPRAEALTGHSTPVVYRPKTGNPLIIAPGSFRMDAYDATNGESIFWVYGLASEMKSIPVLDGDKLYINGFNTPENDPGKQIPVAPFEDVLKQFDKNGDGKISIDESPDKRTKDYFPYTDLNRDGFLDKEEWDKFRAVMAAENGLLAYKMGGKGDVSQSQLLWKYHKAIPQLPSTVLYKGVLYMISDAGVLSTFDPATGTVHKQARLRGVSDRYYASPVASDGKVFIASLSGTVSVLKAGPDQELLSAGKFEDEIYATPAIADGRIYLRTRTALYCFGSK